MLRRRLEPGQYLAIRYTERLAEAGAVPSVGSRGDSYDNALAESFNGLYKAELIRHAGPWQGLDDVEYATLEYVDWFNHRRLHGALGMIPPAEFEAAFVQQPATPLLASSQEDESLRNSGRFKRMIYCLRLVLFCVSAVRSCSNISMRYGMPTTNS